MLRPVHIALLELKLFLNNRAELAFSIALPILLFALMYGALSSESDVFTPASVVDLDGGPHARELVRRLDSLAAVEVQERSEADAADALDRSAILFVVVIPEGFSEALEAGEQAPLVFRQRGNGGDTGQIVAAIVRGIARDMAIDARVRVQTQRALAGSGVPPERIEAEVGAQLASLRARPPVDVEVWRPPYNRLKEWYAEGEESSDDLFSRLLPGLIVMFVMFSVTLAAQAMVEDRRTGTLERLMTTRLGVNQLFIGKLLSGVMRAMFQTVVMLSLAFRRVPARRGAGVRGTAGLHAAGRRRLYRRVPGHRSGGPHPQPSGLGGGVLHPPYGGLQRHLLRDNRRHSDALHIQGHHQRLCHRRDAEHHRPGRAPGQQWLEMAVMVGVAAVGLTVARLLFRITPEGR